MDNPVARWQLITADPDGAASFYRSLFGWRVRTDNALGYRTVESGGIEGGIWPAPPEAQAFVQLFIEVEDVAATMEKAAALGAEVVVPRSVLPDGDTMAVLRDPGGVTFGVMTSRR